MQSRPITLGLVADGPSAEDAFVDLAAAVLRAGGPVLEPKFFASYPGLLEGCTHGGCDAAWAPPLVAHELRHTDVRSPVAIVVREAGAFYYAALVVAADRVGRSPSLPDLAGRRIGWVSPRSAAGYVVPRLQLQALGYDPDRLFGKQSFHFTHGRLLEALARGEIDAAATYAHAQPNGELRTAHVHSARIVMAAGPIPGDVVVARASVAAALSRALERADVLERGPLARHTGVRHFLPAPERHFRAIARWSDLASSLGMPGAPPTLMSDSR